MSVGKKISDLTALTGADLASDDKFEVLDVSAGTSGSKSITKAELANALGSGGAPAGGNKEIQYNNAGVLAGDSQITRVSAGRLRASILDSDAIFIGPSGFVGDTVGVFDIDCFQRAMQVSSNFYFTISGTVDDAFTAIDLGWKRNAAGVLEINSGTAGVLRDMILRYITYNGSLRIVGLTSTAANPTTTELPNDKDLAIHKNTATAAVYLAYNDGGTIKKVQLT